LLKCYKLEILKQEGSLMDILKTIFLGVITISIAFLIVYFISLLLELRKTIETIRKEAIPAVSQIRDAIIEIKPKVTDIVGKVNLIVHEDVKPIVDSMRDIAGKFNDDMVKVNSMFDDARETVSKTKEIVLVTVDENMSKVDNMVDAVNDMVSKTHEVVSIYQNEAVIPAIEVISLWSGITKGVSTFFKRHSKNQNAL